MVTLAIKTVPGALARRLSLARKPAKFCPPTKNCPFRKSPDVKTRASTLEIAAIKLARDQESLQTKKKLEGSQSSALPFLSLRLLTVLSNKYDIFHFIFPPHKIIPPKRKAAFLGQQTYRLNVRVQSQEQWLKWGRLNTERHSWGRIQVHVTSESLRAQSAEVVVTLARERYRL